jgi:hypothetical protein
MAAGGDSNQRPRLRVFPGVIENLNQHLFQQEPVPQKVRQIIGNLHAEASAA